ncbi:MAG: PQQ-binding-like beta-propeller repeat protein [Acidobacteriia bacterium]|nr:PQQ-binding-like beta-propeller repeat protein [Terriglobia bacterium]
MFLHRADRFRAGTWAGIAVLLLGAAGIFGQEHPGMASGAAKADGGGLFEGRCLICHGPAGRATHREALAKLGAEAIYQSISTGVMKEQAAGLTEEERRAIAEFLAGAEKTVAAPPVPACAGAVPEFPGSGPGAAWKGWSPDEENTRFQNAKVAGLTAEEVKRLELRWALVIPNASTLANQVTVTGDWLFLAAQDGTIYALDPRTGCARWTYKAGTGVRTAVRIEGSLVFFGDFEANVYAVDGRTGALRWKQKVEEHVNARITGAPTAHGGLLYVPVSSLEEGVAADPAYVCCTFRGSIVALELATGKQVWKTYSIAKPAAKQGVNACGVEWRGPSGAAIWSAPTVDEKRGVLYAVTGNNYSNPDSQTADAILALDLRTGAIRWHRALRPSDVWNAACLGKKSANCPENEGPDFDFGSSPVLVHRPGGRDMVLAGQKSGVLYALDPQRRGELLWERRLGKGGSVGGILWGFAADGERAYVAISDQDVGSYEADGALNAVDLGTGKLLWRTPNPPETCKDRPRGCSIAMAAPVTVMPGVVFVGSLDGHLRAYDAGSGGVLWDFDVVQDFTGLNGIVGRGGSVDAAGVTLANGFVYQTAGYAAYGLGMAGNVFLAFAPAAPK